MKEKKEKFILIPNCSIVGWRLPGYKKTGFTNTEAKNYGEVIEDMIKYYDSVGATKEEVLSKNLVCIDGSGGGALAQIAWSFKTSKDVLEGKMDKKYLKKEEFEEEFHQELRKIWDGKYSKELALINKYCLLYPSWEDDPELMELEREEKRNEAKEINIDYLLDLSSRKELREEVLKQFLKEDSRIIKFLIKEKLISHLEQADIEKIIEKFNFSILREIGQGNVYLLFNSLMKIANTKSRKALEKEVEVHYINKNQGLQELSLMSYKLEFIPKSIGNLSSLRRLDLSGNELKTLPKSICRLKKLEKLILFWNNLKKLPESIGNLSLLKEFNINGNYITYLPESIKELDFYKQKKEKYANINATQADLLVFLEFKLSNTNKEGFRIVEKISTYNSNSLLIEENKVKGISLYNNGLKSLPKSMGILKSLEVLNLQQNLITKLPHSIGDLTSLKQLDLSGNKLSNLPEFIGDLKFLETLELAGNKLTELPASIANLSSLTSISIFGNKIIEIPKFLKDMKEKGLRIY